MSEDLAKWMIVGFTRCWLMRDVLLAAGLPPIDSQEDADSLHAHNQFMPANYWNYGGKCGTPVRAFIMEQWPKLHAYLDRNHGNAEKLARVIPELVKLKARGVRVKSRHSASDDKEFRQAKLELQRVTTANRAARAQQLSTQRSAWNVCKK